MKKSDYIPEFIYTSSDYNKYLIQYEGDIELDLKGVPGLYVSKINDKYAILTVINVEMGLSNEFRYIKNLIIRNNRDFDSISFFKILEPYTLQEITPLEATDFEYIQGSDSINLKGEGVIVGIIDTGIDYLNNIFMDETGKTRIEFIWDQGVNTKGNENNNIPYGTIYTSNDINKAINAYRNGENPYDIVPSRDEVGHGTHMASLVGGMDYNKNQVYGIASKCRYGIIKLNEDMALKKRFNIKVPVYNLATIFPALEYLKDYTLANSKPMVILLPIESNSGNHKGNSILDKYIKTIASNVGIVIVTGTGNEGDAGGHSLSVIENVGDSEVIELNISEEDKNIILDIWVNVPDVVDVNVISPSGEESGVLSTSGSIEFAEEISFVLEETHIFYTEFVPEVFTGDQLIRIAMHNIRPGIWKIRTTLEKGKNSTINAWIPQRALINPKTRFLNSDIYGSITIPGDSTETITAAGYDQDNFNILGYSGVAFRDDFVDRIDIAAGSKNAVAIGLNNKINIINGTSVAAAMAAGTCALLMEWGIVRRNYPYMSTQSIKTFIARGTQKRKGDIYPNAQWGYGILNLYDIFSNIN
ncbi:MAG: S8 family peptidase [Clostridium sp.]|uniref:S8 family peptidase n=1 Tax=Clostridium sp. TaxID=1506 RepID=UPI0028FE1FD2|nr:S8 family peptidase [Clostridium sp.]MDU1076499.1 S8 family peptidase [Clostridium sp.]MDU1125476.1 S8 family peptidase [Clostridium sp.]MDU3677166.1 S8 family peptidase [Clostridium sp.]MDU6874832.1 S8 family peptidase [Clostridium sp.]MDU6935893.1 S8 family peptidase [Clostridium sp.]